MKGNTNDILRIAVIALVAFWAAKTFAKSSKAPSAVKKVFG